MYFNRQFWAGILSTVILASFFVYILLLFKDDTLQLYIHPRYRWFTVAMSAIALLLMLSVLVVDFMNRKMFLKPATKHASFSNFINVAVVIVLVLAFVLPARPLSSEATGRKSLNVPDYEAGLRIDESEQCSDITPELIQGWVYNIGAYPKHCNINKKVSFTGYIVDSSTHELPDEMFYLGRVVMSCCAVDARPYAIAVSWDNFTESPSGSWLHVEGQLVERRVGGSPMLVVRPVEINRATSPDKPYEYLNIR